MIRIKHNLDRAIKDLQDRSKTAIPRAAVTAMNQCAYEAQQKLRGDFKKQFKSRSPFPITKIVYQKAAFSQWPHLRARVGSQFKAMQWQEEGGTKEATQKLWNAIPLKGNDLESRYQKMPKDLLQKDGYSLIRFHNRYFIAHKKQNRKLKRGKKRGKAATTQVVQAQTRPLELKYELRKQIEFKPRWNLEQTVCSVYQKLYERIFKQKIGKL
jgi:hypothetical protein